MLLLFSIIYSMMNEISAFKPNIDHLKTAVTGLEYHNHSNILILVSETKVKTSWG